MGFHLEELKAWLKRGMVATLVFNFRFEQHTAFQNPSWNNTCSQPSGLHYGAGELVSYLHHMDRWKIRVLSLPRPPWGEWKQWVPEELRELTVDDCVLAKYQPGTASLVDIQPFCESGLTVEIS